MDLQNIKEGMIIKNYNEMCDLLNEECTTGKSKQLQLKQWARYFDWEKQGHKFIIKEIYAEPMPEDFSDNDVYTKYIQTILTKYLKVHGNGEFAKTQLLELCGFVNENWNDVTMLDKYVNNENITYAEAKYHFNKLRTHVYSYCVTALYRCLNRLSKRDFLRWWKVLYIQEEGMKFDEYRLATDNEYSKYLDIVMETKETMGIKYINDYNKKEYYCKLNEAFKENGWNNAYELIKIISANKFADYMIKESEEEYREALLEVNDHCLQQMYKYVDTEIEKDMEKIANDTGLDVELATLWWGEERKRKKKEITNLYIDVKWHELFDDKFNK